MIGVVDHLTAEGVFEAAVEEAAAVPGALGAVLCDFEGEAVVTRWGVGPLPPDVEAEAQKHVPNAVRSQVSVGQYLLRLAAAEPCALLMTFSRKTLSRHGGPLDTLEIAYRNVGLVVLSLPEDFYLVIVLDRKRIRSFGHARRVAQKLRPRLVREIT